MPVDLFMAWKFLREGRTQSFLIAAAIAIGVSVIVFLSALIGGLQEDLLAKTLGTQAHIVLRLPDEEARPLLAQQTPEDEAQVLTRVESTAQRARAMSGWPKLVDELDATAGIEAVSPVVSGPAFAQRGGVTQSIAIVGVIPDRHVRIVDINSQLTEGRMVRGGTDAIIGVELATAIGVETGSKLRVSAADGRTELLTVVGIFDLGNQAINERWVITPLRAGQTLLDHVGAVTRVDLRLPDPFEAESVARRLQGQTGLESESWMETNAQLLTALRSQYSSSIMIQFFVILSVSIGIASVLVVSVVQKRKQIGIMRAMGLSRARVARIFVYQGGLLGLLGSIAGVALGVGLAEFFTRAAMQADQGPEFPIQVSPDLMINAGLIAFATGLVAAAMPAIRASRLDPAEAIRNE
jgi:lipoprotein-releasing system permease protein